MTQPRGRLHSVESCGTVDGPGIRFVAFMQGCLMRCKYCHNRDTWELDGGREVTVDELMEEVHSYRRFLDASGGGVTASGGEAVLQADFVGAWFKACRAQGIHTCLDTNGFVRHYTPALDALLDNTDLVLLDLKQMNDTKHIDLTKVSNKYTLQFARYLHERQQRTWVRYVVLDGYTSDEASVRQMAEFVKSLPNIEKIELLPYHEMGKYKWEAYGDTYPLTGSQPPSKETMEKLVHIIGDEYGIPVAY